MILGQSITFPGTCQTLSLNGNGLLGQRTAFSVGERSQHDLRLACG
jgi:hypothetical protein